MRGTRQERREQARRLWDEGPEAHDQAEESLDRVIGGMVVIVVLMLVGGAARFIFWP